MRVLFYIETNEKKQFILEEVECFTYCTDRVHDGRICIKSMHDTRYYSTERVSEDAFGVMSVILMRNGNLEISSTGFAYSEE